MESILNKICEELKIGPQYISNYKLARCEQPLLSDLEIVEIDFEGKPFILAPAAANAWRAMRVAAKSDAIVIEPFSGFRSYVYQKQLIQRKLDRGMPIEKIITETAIPGFSEHHSGRAIDICTDGIYKLTEEFEKTGAFAWLDKNAGRFGFAMSYPRDNDRNIIYEPWHWYLQR